MYDNYLRRVKDHVTNPICTCVPSWTTPNHITLFAFLSGLISLATAIWLPRTTFPLALWLLNRFLDGLDGALARQQKRTSDLGGFLDLLGDFIIYSLIPISLGLGQSLRALDWVAIAVLEATFHINNFVLFYVAAAVATKPGQALTSVAQRPALIEGFESGLLFTAMFLWPQWLTVLCWAMAAAVVVGIAQRATFVVSTLGSKQEDGNGGKRL
ncbi:hypothetical protein B0A49_12984 [Cryomyces minteri]|uniref:CDP-alcohol phosphatidyltransferase class-I family protein C22A12.08c n=1 Tax=Cryomyces minteri TaxID=331657 RepID=A0A4U0VA13_9PEZI|nr:hypothetical protein B0A49_12984 [Cryomyces minteri]